MFALKCIAFICGSMLTCEAIFASSWTCTNKDIEILCNNGKCSASEDSKNFTPSSVKFDEKGAASFCPINEICYTGKMKVLNSGEHILLSGSNIRAESGRKGKASFLIGMDKSDNIAVVKSESFAMPMICARE